MSDALSLPRTPSLRLDGRRALVTGALVLDVTDTAAARAARPVPHPGQQRRRAFREWALPKIALGRFGTPQDVMGAVLFLAGDASALMTGSALMLDGGWTAS